MPRCKKCLKWVLWGKLSPQGLCADCQQKADWEAAYKAEQEKKREALFAAQQAQRAAEKEQAEKAAREAAEKAARAAAAAKAAVEAAAKPAVPQAPTVPARSYTSVQTMLHILHDGDDVYSETVVLYHKMQDMTKTSLNYILRSEKYIGTYIHNRTEPQSARGKRSSRVRPVEQQIRIPGGMPAIIDQAT